MAAGGHSPTANKAAAQADAAANLKTVRLPPDAMQSMVEPAGGGRILASPNGAPVDANFVDRHQWWTVPQSPRAVIRYVKQHQPAGSHWTLSGTAKAPGKWSYLDYGYGWPPVPGVISSRQLVVTAMPLAHHMTGLRVDAEDIWITPRPASEQIPASAAHLRLTVTKFGRRIEGPRTFVSPTKVHAVIELLDSLPADQPGARSCPADWGSLVRLAFYDAGRRTPAAVATVDPSGCGQVTLSLDGRSQPLLASWPIPGHPHATVIGLLEKDLGVRVRDGFPRPPG